MKSLDDLTANADPAIDALRALAAQSPRNALWPVDESLAARSLLALQVSTRAMLGAQVHGTGGISAFDGRLRLLGSGGDAARSLLGVNIALGLRLEAASPPGLLVVADDVLGGMFALNGGALGADHLGHVFWLPPDEMAWCDLEVGHSAFVSWCLTGEWDALYASVQAPAAAAALAQPAPAFDQSWSFAPWLWTAEGQAAADARVVPANEVLGLRLSLMGLGG
ncbi:DUF2625 family protein [Comamonas serinivorans]|uniref:DUF2625 family protein n=1 Tax=Comamonas serinivorans TaxID=1082851 RepID=UPI0012F90D09|nr:DUF2625 family protein [Comamonas serinivorans]